MTTALDPAVPFVPRWTEAQIASLRERLATARWPDAETGAGWSQGVPLDYLRDLCEYWRDDYDWTAANERLAALPQFRIAIDGLQHHFVHLRSAVPGARPLLLVHGWPGSFLEFAEVAPMLADPERFGGDPADAFHVVCPSLPGYGFSEQPAELGWDVARTGRAFATLMQSLGYPTFFAQGGDWGSSVVMSIARDAPDLLRGLHLNFLVVGTDATVPFDDPTEFEIHCVERTRMFFSEGTGYSTLQATKPQTVSYGLADSAVGQCAWIVEKFQAWTDNDGTPESAISRDHILDDINVYWFGNRAASSARMYWESLRSVVDDQFTVRVPSAYTVFPHDTALASERWARLRLADLQYYSRAESGGHFAAMEQPALFVSEVRAALRAIGSTEPGRS